MAGVSGVRLNWPSGFEDDYIMLRRFFVGDEYDEEEALFYGREVTRRIRDRLLEAIMMVNDSVWTVVSGK